MKAHELAAELVKLAEHLTTQPDMEIGRHYLTNASYDTTGEEFKNIAKVMPKPLSKDVSTYSVGSEDLILTSPDCYVAPFSLHFRVERNKVCKVITPAVPAVYECEPLLTPEEESALTQ